VLRGLLKLMPVTSIKPHRFCPQAKVMCYDMELYSKLSPYDVTTSEDKKTQHREKAKVLMNFI
jgi:hypothetical protein